MSEKANRVIGRCHGCGQPGQVLTFEHIPPRRAFNNRGTLANSMGLYELEKDYPRRLPRTKRYPRGMGTWSLCERCQQFTQHHYNDAFGEWIAQVQHYADQIRGDEYVNGSFNIRPLNVIKQIATMVLAAAKFNGHRNHEHLRRFIQLPHERHLPVAFEFFAYLNPRRPGRELPQSRMETDAGIVDIKKGTRAFVVADIAHPPAGYVAVYSDTDKPLMAEARALTCISHFGHAEYGKRWQGWLRLAVRTPFGPAPLRYSEDAANDPPEEPIE